ncbi:formylglycine-generating enzyme family protein [Roseomonas eburnea]|uniref:Formylglycine-generating enzyme family protein n=1 Tax=Neoroseomonas eburnea TaxID=1346889 RepID=A0A9X9X5F1_9PROT|nr:formylglycine-generating enzyme family protein [Neoroseomonas eburnea]MBR0678937.1 formylglycine-generating enzyme family protein [Neoroseomonas eburnea]
MRAATIVLGLVLSVLAAGAARAQVKADGSGPFRDCADCPEMVTLPGGTFVMGVPPGEEEREGVPENLRGRSSPQHRITIAPGLAMATRSVTRAQFAVFVNETGLEPGRSCWTFVNRGTSYEYAGREGLTWREPGFQQGDDHPVVCVNWEDATAYAAWLSRRTGRSYRLPSEAEWEYAARAGTTTARYWGEPQTQACDYANVADLTLAAALELDRRPQFTFRCSDGHVYTAPVGSFRPNAFGLHDMLGNVWQWTADCLNPSLEGQRPDGAARLTGDCEARAMRGGSWSHLPWYVRAGNRARGTAVDRFVFAGIRVVRDR